MEVKILEHCFADDYPIVRADVRQELSAGLWQVPVGVRIYFDLRDCQDLSAGTMLCKMTLPEAKMLAAKLMELVW